MSQSHLEVLISTGGSSCLGCGENLGRTAWSTLVDGIMELSEQLLLVVLYGLTPQLDKDGFQVHSVLIVGPAPPPDRP